MKLHSFKQKCLKFFFLSGWVLHHCIKENPHLLLSIHHLMLIWAVSKIMLLPDVAIYIYIYIPHNIYDFNAFMRITTRSKAERCWLKGLGWEMCCYCDGLSFVGDLLLLSNRFYQEHSQESWLSVSSMCQK